MSLAETFAQLSPQFKEILAAWWIWVPILLAFVLYNLWLSYVRFKFKALTTWTFFEIRIPREILKTPRSMEQVFAGMHSLRNTPGDIVEKYVDGEVTYWFSFEIVSFSGDVHFYIRTPTRYRSILQALLYAQYPDIELVEAQDYMDNIPETVGGISDSGYKLWGAELRLVKDDSYPIRTYEDLRTTVEEEQLDPISALVELLGNLQRGEKIFVQMLVRPTGDEWVKEGEKLLKELKAATVTVERKRKTSQGVVELVEGSMMRAPGETDLLKAIDRNISKPGFETIVRFFYLAKPEVYNSRIPRRGVYSCFNQYATHNMNSFKRNPRVETEARWVRSPYIFPKHRLEAKKRRMLRNYRERRMPEEMFTMKLLTSEFFDWNVKSRAMILNTEELATIWHLPSKLVLTAPYIHRVESRKIGPPAGLPIFGSESESTPWGKSEEED